jgi:hypothetical protein
VASGRTGWLVGASVAAFVAIAIGVALEAEQRPDPVEGLRQQVLRYTGAEPVECGRHLLVQQERRWVAADEVTLQSSVTCGLTAASGKRAFWTFKQDQGIDSWVASGILGTVDGVLYRFHYDSAPCGGPGCASRISFQRCDKPSAATNLNQLSEFRCGR